MKKPMAIILCLVSLSFHAGCASIVDGRTQDVMIRSEPPQAAVIVDGAKIGRTPMIASLRRKQRHTIEIRKEDYESQTRATTKGFNWWYVGNLIFGGVIGLIVDPITGAMFEVNPDHISVELEKTGPGVSQPIAAAPAPEQTQPVKEVPKAA